MADSLSADLASLKIDRNRNPNRRGALRYLLTAAALIGVALVVYLILVPYVESRIFKVEVAVSEISLISPAQAQIELTSTGYVKPQRISRVAAKVTGKVAKASVSQGDRVARGDVLFELEVVDQKAAIAAANARVAAARARAHTARANLAEIVLQAKRAGKLAAGGVGPQSTADDLAARAVSLRQQVRAADAEIDAIQAEVHALEVTLEGFTVTAPIAGTVLSEPPEVGEIVGPQPAGISTDFGSIEIADFDTLVVETDVPEARLHLVAMNGPAEIILDAFPGKRYRGTTLQLVPRVNRAKATVTVKVAFVDAADGVLPDMAARVSFLAAELDPQAIKEPAKLVVPGAALVERSGAKVIFVVDDGRVRMTPVTVGKAQSAGVELMNGPPAGTRVVKNPPDGLTDGQAVKERINE
ncbi:MAG: efflux RND transporter periplasmic adaptor subunit [Proteobacteria bacterium]|nr:efflux RND transporter periplasmic adaptor subunit [Pseudomonadota bacterium]